MIYANQQRELARERAHSEALGWMVTGLERSNRELDEFAYAASHDLRELLRGIAINANFLSREGLSERGQERVDRMLVLTERMDKQVSDLLSLSRLGRVEKVTKDLDPKYVADGICKELTEWLAERGGSVWFGTDRPWVHAEHSKVKSVFQNLIEIGLKHKTSKRPQILISAESGDKNEVTLMVYDNGVGISAEDLSSIFDPLKRADTDERNGVGLGLSICRKIVERHGGKIWCRSTEGQGSDFSITLPVAAGSH